MSNQQDADPSVKTKKVFVSAESPLQHDGARALLDRLKSQVEVVWFREHRGYDVIERKIEKCDALVAIVDDRWSCSTWMMIELHRALGLPASGLTDLLPMAPIPAFVYRLYDTPTEGFMQNLRGAEFLPLDAEDACNQILNCWR